nr:sensor histidine kinase [Cellulophaga sp. F20128]
MGSVTNALNEFDRALEYYKKALEYQKKIKTTNTYNLSVLNNIGNANRDKKDYIEALKFYEKVLETDSLKEKKPSFYAKVLDNLAYTQFKKGDTLSVEFHLLKSLQLRNNLNDISGLSISHFNLAEFYLSKNDSIKSLHHAKLSEEYSFRDKNNKRLLQTYDLLTKVDPTHGSNYAHKYIVLNDSLVNEERSLQEKFTRIKFETDEVIGEKQVLEKQNQLLISLVIGALLLAFAVFIIGSQYLKNQKLKFEQEQQQINLETFNLMLSQKGKLIQARKEVQEKISQELHDGVIGSLTGIALILKATNKKADEETIVERLELIKQLQETSEEIRTISHTLSAASSEKLQNFISTIKELLNTTQRSSNIETKLTYDSKIEWDLLNADIKINLYRIIQEGVQNCVKYAQAKNIFLNFSIQESNLSVILSDNGEGFNVAKKKKGIGLKNIYSRVAKINATIDISSEIGQGTEISISIPLHSSEIITTNKA